MEGACEGDASLGPPEEAGEALAPSQRCSSHEAPSSRQSQSASRARAQAAGSSLRRGPGSGSSACAFASPNPHEALAHYGRFEERGIWHKGVVDMYEVKQRRKVHLSAKPHEEQQKQPWASESLASEKSSWMDPRTASGLLTLTACIGLTWFLFHQSAHLAAVEEKYHILKRDAEKYQDMENKINLMSEKFESSSGILQEASTSVTRMTKFEQEVSSLRNIMHDIQSTEQALSKKIWSINEKFQNVIDSWKRSKDEMHMNTRGLKSETKLLHSTVTSQINAADQKIKNLSERLKDLEDSTVRNVRTLKRQEEDELSKVEQQLQFETKAAEKLEEQQNTLLTRNSELGQKLNDYEPKMEEYKTCLPTIESAVRSVVRVSSELLSVEKKIEDMTMKVFSMEDEMTKAVSEIMDIQKTLEAMQYENSILKLQNEVILKGKVHDVAESMPEVDERNLESHQSVDSGD